MVGKYADVNKMRRLIVEMADACALAKWQEMNYSNEATALARLKLHFRRIVGLAQWCIQAKMTESRKLITAPNILCTLVLLGVPPKITAPKA